MALVRQNSPKIRVFKFYQKLMNGIFQIFSWNFVSVKKFYGELKRDMFLIFYTKLQYCKS